MMRRVLRSSSGFTYMTVLVMVVVIGIMSAQAAQVWKTVMQRERETELISRGTQIRDAMRRWYKFRIVEGNKVEPFPAGTPKALNLPELKSLLKDPNNLQTLRYLRPYALIDPMNHDDDHEWDVVRRDGRIVGVKSTSTLAPLKQGNFPFDLHPADFEKKKKYSEWEFIYDRIPPAPGAAGAITGLPQGAKSPGTMPD